MAKRSVDKAKKAKEDEFYTRLTDIEKELRHYKNHFKDKTVLCNCDDPFESNFFKYFVLNFNYLGLKKLIATCYFSSPITGDEFGYTVDENGQLSIFFGDETPKANNENKKPYKAIVTKVYDKTGDGGVDMIDVAELFKSGENELSELEGDGDFRSPECLELLEEADIVATNPPFSLFREYVALLVKHNKKFVIVGPRNAITYKETFPLIKNNEMWVGYGFAHGDAYFHIPAQNARDFASGVYDSESGLVHFRNCTWFTNLNIKKRNEEKILVARYNSNDYPRYDNYEAINVDKVAMIPCDYSGIMGVPITFMDDFNPEQFEIINLSRYLTDSKGMSKEFVDTYYAQGNKGQISEGHPDLCYYTPDGKAVVPYMRVLIRNKHPEQPREKL